MSLLLLTYNLCTFYGSCCYSSKCSVNLFYSCMYMHVYIVFSLDSVSNKTTTKSILFPLQFSIFCKCAFFACLLATTG